MELELPDSLYLLAIAFAIALLLKRYLQSTNLPPGPCGLPFLGYLPFLGRYSYETFHQLGKKYGSIFSIYLGTQLMVVLEDAEVTKDILSTPPVLERPKNAPNDLLPNATTFVAANGSVWREQRRFAMHCLRDLGFGITKLEKHIREEIDYFLDHVGKYDGQPFDLGNYLRSSMSNNIIVSVFGRRMKYDDREKIFIDDHVQTLTQFFRPVITHSFFPWIIPLFSFFHIWDYHVLSKTAREMEDFIVKEIAEHQKTLDKDNARDYIDEFLIKMEEMKAKGQSSSFNMKILKGSCLSLTTASVDPTLNTAKWLMLVVALRPEVQEKIQKELDSVVGRTTLPEWSHRTELPYTMAALMELQRWKSVLPLSLLRCVGKGFTYKNYYIPKGSFITANLWSIHRDERYWESPSEYKPERFLDEDGKLIAKHDSYMPFSYGKRACPGDNLAKIITFLYLTNVLHRFHVRVPDGMSEKDYVCEYAVAQQLLELKMCLVPRED